MPETKRDRSIRLRAFDHVLALERRYRVLSWNHIARGFEFEGEKIHLATKARGIFKPTQMDTLLSIKTVIPRPGRRVWYDDQQEAHRAAFREGEHFEYALEGGGPQSRGNMLLRQAFDEGIPIIYFFPLAPGVYQPIIPTFVYGFDDISDRCFVGLGASVRGGSRLIESRTFKTVPERRYAMRQVRQRLHQSMFRQAVLSAYEGRCAVSGLPEASLLDAAHIVEDSNESLGQPVVQNGLLLSSIHHSAYDNDLIGIDPDYRVHVSTKLLNLSDGPMLETLKEFHGIRIRLPSRSEDSPDKERLEKRFNRFRTAA